MPANVIRDLYEMLNKIIVKSVNMIAHGDSQVVQFGKGDKALIETNR